MPVIWLFLAGCASDPVASIQGGDHQFFTTSADDDCLDGAFEVLFMPNGPDTPHPFEFPVFLPAPEDTPATYEVSFRAPFVGMTVTVVEREDGLGIDGSVIDAVRLNTERYGDCDVTMTIDATLIPSEPGTLLGTATIAVSNPRGSEGRCPPLDSDPCGVRLTLQADRLDTAR